MRIAITGTGLLVCDGPGPIEDFNPRGEVPNRKHLKLMSRGVRLGIAAVGRALASRPGWDDISPERRGLFVGANPAGTDPSELKGALARCDGDLAAFGEVGIPLVHPLWLVKGLSNNILGYATAYWGMRGPNGNRCEGRTGGLAAILEAARALDEGRLDLAVAGGADSLIGAESWLGRPTGEGAAFFVLERAGDEPSSPCVVAGGLSWSEPEELELGPRGELGAAAGAVEVALRLADEEPSFRVEVADWMGSRAWVQIAG